MWNVFIYLHSTLEIDLSFLIVQYVIDVVVLFYNLFKIDILDIPNLLFCLFTNRVLFSLNILCFL